MTLCYSSEFSCLLLCGSIKICGDKTDKNFYEKDVKIKYFSKYDTNIHYLNLFSD